MAKKTSSSESNLITINLQPLFTPLSILIGSIFISIAIVSHGYAPINSRVLSQNDSSGETQKIADQGDTVYTVNVDNDPIKGDTSSDVYIVEFSDYECSFCQRFYQQTLDLIEENYISTGKAALVYRDFPLSIHEPEASYAANIMECTREKGGDESYFAMHDFWFETSPSNGAGISDRTKISNKINDLGLNGKSVLECAESGKFNQEIQDDMQDGIAAGISGTPGFVIGTKDADGNVVGSFINGALPYSEFERTIESYL